MTKLTVTGLPSNDAGRQIIRLHYSHRGGAARYGIVKLTNNGNGRKVRAVVLGHEDDKNIYMPFDIRVALGVDKNATLDFDIEKVGWIGRLRWYVEADDPAISIPAWIAVIGLVLAVAGFAASLVPLLC